MKLIFIFLAILNLSVISWAKDFKKLYADRALNEYTQVKNEAVQLSRAVDIFLANPSETNLDYLKAIWTEARKIYSQTEIYRFYGGPIDGLDGPEGLINAWPLDEAYIDYVDGNSMGGIINLTSEYPEITFKVLTELNENNGETNISTGWHAIEFLLWGQDFNDFGPGQRPYTDFVVGQGLNAQRRREYLKVATELLVQHLDSVLKQWNKNDAKSYYNEFLNLSDTEALTKVFTSLISMSADELAIERIFVAYDTQFQEDEHSCFSDTTHFDIKYNFLGIKNIWNLVMSSTNIPNLDPNLVLQIQNEIFKVESSIESFVPPFDRAIFDQDQRAVLQNVISGLQQLGNSFKDAGLKLGAAL